MAGLFVFLVVILDFGCFNDSVYKISWFLFSQMHANMHNLTLIPANVHAPCTPRYKFYIFFLIGFNFIGLFNLSLLDFCTCYFSFIT